MRVTRGAYWGEEPNVLRPVDRGGHPDWCGSSAIGFRVMRELSP